MDNSSAEGQLESFLDKFLPEIADRARCILDKMRVLLPGAVEMVYDNYNALVIGFGPTEKASEAPFSIAVYPRWINLFFLTGIELSDPDGLLKGTGNQVRSIRLTSPDVLDDPAVQALMRQAHDRAGDPIDPSQARRIVIKSISAKQRPRRPK